MPPVKLKDDIFWVGAIDWNLRNFHGYSQSKRGTTYNAFLVLDDKKTLFDTVSKATTEEMFERIEELVGLEEIDYIIVNHAEPDHSGALPQVVSKLKPEKVFCSKMCEKALSAHYDISDWPLETVEPGQTISLGKRTVTFMETRMLHWPDSMFSYIPEEKLLISSDAFGQNIASSERFDDEVDQAVLFQEAEHYYANIITPYSNLVRKVLDRVTQMGLDIEMIAPDHGVIWRTKTKEIVEAYAKWSKQDPGLKAVITYDTMWQSTDKMAKAIAEGCMAEGVSVKLMNLKTFHHSDVMYELFSAGALIVGSPTHNNGILPLVADVLTYLKGLKPKRKVGAAFGSYGWSGEAVKIITGYLEEMNVDLVDGLKVQYVPQADHLEQCRELGKAVAQKLKQSMET